MLSFGIAAFTIDKVLVSTFTRNLELLPGAVQHPRVMAWWQSTAAHRAAYERTRENVQPVRESMLACEAWSKSLRAHGKPCARSDFDHASQASIDSRTGCTFSRVRSYAARCAAVDCHHAITRGCCTAPGSSSRLRVNVETSTLSMVNAAIPNESIE